MANYSAGAMGALGGAGTGATLGSAFGPIGTGVGAGLGALTGGLAGLFGGTPEQSSQVSRFNPQIQQQLNQLISQKLANQSQGFDFAPIEQQARTGFQQQTVPALAERFSALGARGSSAFTQALGQAGAGLEQSLAALKSKYGLQQQTQEQNLLKALLSLGQQENLYSPAQPGFVESAAGGFGQGLGSILPLLPLLFGGEKKDTTQTGQGQVDSSKIDMLMKIAAALTGGK